MSFILLLIGSSVFFRIFPVDIRSFNIVSLKLVNPPTIEFSIFLPVEIKLFSIVLPVISIPFSNVLEVSRTFFLSYLHSVVYHHEFQNQLF